MRRVLIGAPTHTGQMDVHFTHSIGETIRLCTHRGDIDLRALYIGYDSLIQNARNDIVAAAIQCDFDDLIFIDADQEWDPNWVLRLLSHPVDCVGGAVRKKTDQDELYNVRARGGIFSFINHPTAPLISSPDMALGCGFLRLSRKALLALWDTSEPYTAYRDPKPPSRWIFDVRPMPSADPTKIAELNGEDTIVADKLRKLGIETWLDPSMTCAHIGPKKYIGNFMMWLAKMQSEAKAG